jgi:hypothetical protein
MILDGTPANAFEVMRRETGGGFHALNDFSIPPLRRWLTSQWEVYSFTDEAPSDFVPPTYAGLGLIGGRITPNNPLTNPATVNQGFISFIDYSEARQNCNPQDTLFTMQWSAVPNAVRYWIHVYKFSIQPTPEELLASSLPSVVNDIRSSDVFVGYVDTVHVASGGYLPPATTYKLGDASRTDVKVLLHRVTPNGSTYYVRITAVDANGQLIGCTPGDYEELLGDGFYLLIRLGAVRVSPTTRPITDESCGGSTLAADSAPEVMPLGPGGLATIAPQGLIQFQRMAGRGPANGWSTLSGSATK